MDRKSIIGDWDLGFREISIVEQGPDLLLTCPDAPPGYEGRLSESSPDRWRVHGGALHGAEIVMSENEPSIGGYRRMRRLERAAQAPPGSGITAPTPETHPDEAQAYEGLWNWLAHPSREKEVDTGGLEVGRFLRWLTARQLVLFHGANRVDLDRLEPSSWPSVTIGSVDRREIVYATGDSLCAMFLALVDETRTGRGARHRVERFHAVDGDYVDVYHFSLPRPALEQRAFRPGGLYLLPRERFQPVPLYPGGPASPEWTSPEPVHPLACLLVSPDDFPLWGAVGPFDRG